jgi:hypothetical protein
MAGRLIDRTGHQGRTVYVLTSATTMIGRGHDNDIVIAGEYVSAHHARVCWDGSAYVLHDCGSTNGTLVNGDRLAHAHVLRDGDTITLPGRPPTTLVFDACAGTAELPAGADATVEYRLDARTAEVHVRGRRVRLTAKEYRALSLLSERGGALVSKEELAIRVWPEYEGIVADYNIEQLIARLRRKLDGDRAHPSVLLTVRGLGYRLAA